MKNITSKLGLHSSRRTTFIGYGLIAAGIWAFKVHWVPGQSAYFNLMYAEIAPIAIIASGIVAILTREQREHDRKK